MSTITKKAGELQPDELIDLSLAPFDKYHNQMDTEVFEYEYASVETVSIEESPTPGERIAVVYNDQCSVAVPFDAIVTVFIPE